MFNQILSPEDRMCRRLHKPVLLAHEMAISATLISSCMKSLSAASSKQKKCQKYCSLLNMLRKGQRGEILAQYNRKFREAIIVKLQGILDPDSDEISTCTPYFKKKLRGIATELLSEVIAMDSKTLRSSPIPSVANDLSLSYAVFRG